MVTGWAVSIKYFTLADIFTCTRPFLDRILHSFLCDAELGATRSYEHNILRWPAGVVMAGVTEVEEIVVVLSHAAIVVAEATEEETVVVLLLGAAVVTLLPEEIAVVSFPGEAEEDVVHLLRWKSCKWS